MFVAAIWLAFGRAPVLMAPISPETALIAAVTRTGLIHIGSKPVAIGEQLLTFEQENCPAPVGVLYLASISRLSPAARQLIDAPGHSTQVIYDGSVVDGLSFGDIFWRWLWRKVVMAVTFEPRNPWTTSLIVVLAPANCTIPPVDWTQVSRRS